MTAVEATTVVEDDDEDWTDFDIPSNGDEDAEHVETRGDTTLAEKIDANMTEQERKLRMTLCIGLTREKFTTDSLFEHTEKIAEITGMPKEQVANNMQLNMVKNCYLNLDVAKDMPELTSGDSEKFKIVSEKVFAPPVAEETGEDDSGTRRSQPTLLQRQWELIRDVIESEAKDADSADDDDPYSEFTKMDRGRMEVIGSQMTSFQKFLYFVSVFGVVFGGGYLLVKKLIRHEMEKSATRKSKGSSRASSAENKKAQ
jgi:hypothetical protein